MKVSINNHPGLLGDNLLPTSIISRQLSHYTNFFPRPPSIFFCNKMCFKVTLECFVVMAIRNLRLTLSHKKKHITCFGLMSFISANKTRNVTKVIPMNNAANCHSFLMFNIYFQLSFHKDMYLKLSKSSNDTHVVLSFHQHLFLRQNMLTSPSQYACPKYKTFGRSVNQATVMFFGWSFNSYWNIPVVSILSYLPCLLM